LELSDWNCRIVKRIADFSEVIGVQKRQNIPGGKNSRLSASWRGFKKDAFSENR
jgi:hypothetical protein